MTEPPDMSTPVTRGELREELAGFEQRFEQKLDQKFDHKLEIWAGAILARMDMMFEGMTALVANSEQRLHEDLARHTRAIEESMRTLISGVDDKYVDLPERVTTLEQAVFPSTPSRKRARRRRAS